MNRSVRRCCLLIAAACLGVIGCGDGEPPTIEAAPNAEPAAGDDGFTLTIPGIEPIADEPGTDGPGTGGPGTTGPPTE